jgi:hypothetical protein
MAGAAHELHRGGAWRIKHQTIPLIFAAPAMKNFENRFMTRCVIPPQGRDDDFACRFIPAQHSVE